jgi:hypothetical protein
MGKTPCVIVAVLVLGTTAARAGTPKCLALDANDGALILESANASATRCAAQLEIAMKKRRCPARATRRATIEYTTYYEHRGVKGKLVTLSCAAAARAATAAAPAAPKCRAIDDRTRSAIAVASQASSARCALLLASEVKKQRCTKRTRGKKIAYTARFEQRGAKDKRVALVCE